MFGIFRERIYEQIPFDQMFVNIVSDERALAKENKGNTELEWHIDKGYSENV